MQLGDYIPNVKKKFNKIFFSGISFNSSNVKKNNIFFAIKGTKVDGNKFIQKAIKKGSKIVVSEKSKDEFQNGILFIRSRNVRKLLAEVSSKIYKKKPKNIIAVTGTNGKSSIANFYYQILKLNKKKVASIGTLGVKSKKFNISLPNTTIDPIQMGQILTKLKEKNIDNVIIEASSHGLEQNRLDGLKFQSGIFTNFSHDHLDYHKNFKNYLKAKLYLFKNLIKKGGSIITDEDLTEFKKIKKISIHKKLKLETINKKQKSKFEVLSHFFEGDTQILKIRFENSVKIIKLNLIGKIQIKNLLMAMIAAKKSNLNMQKILNVIPKINSVEGRFENIGLIKNKSKVILDYAHTPEALKTCLINLKEQFPNKKISLLFGCGGERDQNKRSKMGKIASSYSDQIYLTDDNPRFEDPKKIRKDIKNGIKKNDFIEIPNRAKAISLAIKNLKTGDILLVAGKGHERFQEKGKQKIYFSDKETIINSIKIKNTHLSKNLKLNILKEVSENKEISPNINFKKANIDSRNLKRGDVYFAIKGKNNDGNKFVKKSLKKAVLAIVNKISTKSDKRKQIKVKNTLSFLTNISKVFRNNIHTKIVGITGSCGKTTLKELLGNTLKKINTVSISPKSYNNKYGVPLSLFNINPNDDYGVLEIGMDKKGEIDYLSKILRPDISVITNISYAHIKNFRKVEDIASAKAEIIGNTKSNGKVILNADDKFFRFHKTIAKKNNLESISFGIKNQSSQIKFINLIKKNRNYLLNVKVKSIKKKFLISNNFENNIYNILATLSVMSVNTDISGLNENIFLDFKIPQGRGDLIKIKLKNKSIKLIDESYNSNPLSLETALSNYDKLDSKNKKKYLLLGDMLELGKHSKKLHERIVQSINLSNIDKVFVKGNKVINTFNKLIKSKKGKILYNKSQIINMITNELDNNDYLMVKASNATGLNKIVNELRGIR